LQRKANERGGKNGKLTRDSSAWKLFQPKDRVRTIVLEGKKKEEREMVKWRNGEKYKVIKE